jgi:ABC-type Fe3+-hydroxamate transport system substrate-binding protein
MQLKSSLLTALLMVFITACSSFTVPHLSYENTKTKYVTINETEFGYRRMGYGSQAPLVLIQHHSDKEHVLEPQVIDELAKDRTVIVFNNKRAMATEADAQEFIRQLGIQKVEVVNFSQPDEKAYELIAKMKMNIAKDNI